MRVQLSAAIASNGKKTNIVVPLKATPGIVKNKISELRGFINQPMYIFTLVKAIIEVALSSGQGVAEHGNRIAFDQVSGKALLVKEHWAHKFGPEGYSVG